MGKVGRNNHITACVVETTRELSVSFGIKVDRRPQKSHIEKLKAKVFHVKHFSTPGPHPAHFQGQAAETGIRH